jgi:hypothetical protein
MIIAQAKAGEMQAKTQENMMRLKMDMEKFEMEVEALSAQIAKTKADTMLSMAKAESEINEDALAAYKHDMDMMTKEVEIKVAMMKDMAQRQHQMQMAQQGQQGQMQMAQLAAKQKGAQSGGIPVKK